MTTALTTLSNRLAAKLDLGDGGELLDVLKNTAFRGQVTDAQMTALLLIANQYGLNPWTKEIYAFPDKQNGIVPVVGVDGWARIINSAPEFDGMDFEQDDDSCTCRIYRKDRSHPVAVTEYAGECRRDTGPWRSHPKRMLRHKAMIQCARLAFGFVGIYDEDEAQRIVDAEAGRRSGPQPVATVLISDEQQVELQDMIEGAGADREKFLEYLGVATLADLPVSKLPAAKQALQRKAGAKAAA